MIRSTSDDLLQVETGSLYPALHRLEKKKWIEASWGMSDKNQRVKEYRLTETGRAQLREERTRWEQMSDVMSRILQAPEQDPA
jgi:DNA-binding PadR family transcriptional regulator